MTERELAAAGDFARFVGWVAGCGLLAVLLGFLPTRALAGQEAVRAMFGAVAATGLASILGGCPVLLARLRGRAEPQVVMISMLVRLLAVAVLSAVLVIGLDLATAPFLVWLALAYLLLLVVDTRYATSELKRLG